MPVVKKGGKTVHLPYTNKGMKMAETMKKNMGAGGQKMAETMKKNMGTVRNNMGTMKNTMKKAMPRGK